MKLINLLPKKNQRELKLHLFSEQIVRFWIWTFISIALFLSLTFLAREYLNRIIADTDGQIAVSKQILKSSDNELLKQQVEKLNSQMNAVLTLQSEHYHWSNTLVELTNLLPDDIVLDIVNMDRVSGKVRIEGLARSRESVLKFWEDIHKSQHFIDIDFPLANLNKPVDDPFSFTFYIKTDRIKTNE